MTYEDAMMRVVVVVMALVIGSAIATIIGSAFYEVFWKNTSDERMQLVVIMTYMTVAFFFVTAVVWGVSNLLIW